MKWESSKCTVVFKTEEVENEDIKLYIGRREIKEAASAT